MIRHETRKVDLTVAVGGRPPQVFIQRALNVPGRYQQWAAVFHDHRDGHGAGAPVGTRQLNRAALAPGLVRWLLHNHRLFGRCEHRPPQRQVRQSPVAAASCGRSFRPVGPAATQATLQVFRSGCPRTSAILGFDAQHTRSGRDELPTLNLQREQGAHSFKRGRDLA
jgi:hypothetical protein